MKSTMRLHLLVLLISFTITSAMSNKENVVTNLTPEVKSKNAEINNLKSKIIEKKSEKIDEIKKMITVTEEEKGVKTENKNIPKLEKKNFIQEFILSFSLNFFSEIGDKSFVSIILVYNQISPCVLFIVASISELLMNLFSVIIGYELRTRPMIKTWCHFFGAITALFFGLALLYEVYFSKEEKEEEKTAGGDLELAAGENKEAKEDGKPTGWGTLLKICNVAWIIFMSEFGDKSQITTIILSAEYNPVPIFLGTALAHILGVLLSMTIGYIIAKNMNKMILTTIGALCFIYFGVQTGILFYNEGGFISLKEQLGFIQLSSH